MVSQDTAGRDAGRHLNKYRLKVGADLRAALICITLKFPMHKFVFRMPAFDVDLLL